MKLKQFIFALVAMLSFSFSAFAQQRTVSTEADLREALNGGGEVTLGASITVSAPVTIPSGSEVVLNLNGKTLKATKASTKVLENQGKLTINGQGTVSGIIYNGTGNNSTAEMILNGGTYSLDGNSGGLHHYGNTLTINDGVVVKTTSYGVRMAGKNSVLNLNGGTYTSTGTGDMARPLALSNGTVNFLDSDITVNGHMHVMVGQVTVNFGENNQYSPFEAYHQGNSYASSVFYCKTLAEAINRTGFAAVTLVKNVKVAADAPITVNKEINLNLNGKNLSATNAKTTVLKNYANLTINGKGTVTGLVYNGDADNKGVAEMTLNGGTYKLDGANGGIFNYGKTLTVNDGVTISSQVYGLRMSNAASVINLNGGTFTSTNPTDNMKRAIAVDAGTINFNDDDITINGYLHANRTKAKVNFGEYCPFDAFMYSTTNASGYYVVNLENAIDKADAGFEIVLQKNLERSEIVTLPKKVTLDGNGKTLTSTAGRAINVDCADVVTIENLTIAGATGCERGINIINKAGTTNLKKVNVSGVSYYAVHVATSAGAAKVNIENSNLTGWAAVAAYGENGTINVKNSNLVGIGNATDNTSNDFATIAAASNITVNVTGGKVTAERKEGKAPQAIVCGNSTPTTGAKFVLDTELELKGTAEYINHDLGLDDNTVAVREAYSRDYVTTPADNGLVRLTGASTVSINGVKYGTLQAAINAAESGATIDVNCDIELKAQDAQAYFAKESYHNQESYCGIVIPDDKAIVLNLNGHTISYVDAYENVSNVMILNLGNLTIDGDGVITYKPVASTSTYNKYYSTIFNCGTLTIESGVIENTCETETDVTNAVDNHSPLSHRYGNDCILTVNGGTLSGAYYYAIRQYTHYLEGVKNRVVINDGDINGGIYMQHGDSWYYADPSKNRLNVDCYLTINGGNINVNTTSDAFGKIKSRLNNPDNNAFGIEINGGNINVPVELLVQRGVYYTNGVSGATTPAEPLGTRNAEWLEKNGGFVKGGTFTQVGEPGTTTDLASFVELGKRLKANDNGAYVVEAAPVATVNDDEYFTLEAAAAAAQAGDEIKMYLDATLEADLTLPAGITFNGNGKQVNGKLIAGGKLTFAGHTKVTNFDAGSGNEITIGEGVTLELTGTGRMVIGHGCTFNITGQIAQGAAKTTDKASLKPSLVMPGASFTGAGVTFNVTNAYIKATAYCSSKNSSANGTFDFNIENSIWEQTGSFVFTEPSTGKDPIFNLELKNSVLNSTSHLVFAVTKGEIVFDNSNVNGADARRQIENRSNLTVKNGSVVYGAVATSSNAKNPGTLTVDNATYNVTGEFSGSDLGTGTIIVNKSAKFAAGSVTKANIVVDATDMAAGDVVAIEANLAKFAGTLTVENNDKLMAKIVDGKIVLDLKPVATVNGVEYKTLEAAFKAATSGCTIEILENVTVDYAWDARYTGGKFTVPVTINGNGKTIKFTASVNDNNYQAAFRFEADATVNNLVVDMSEVTDNRFRAISSKGNLTVDGCKFIGKDESLNCRAIIFGEGAGENVGNLAVAITNSEFINWKRGITDNENAQDVKTVTITGNTLTDAGVAVSAKENVTFTGNTVEGAYVNIKSYTAGNKLKVTATGNTLEENTDAAYNVIDAGGVVNAEGFNIVPKGNNFNGYTGTDGIWGEVWGNARVSFVINVLDANGNVMGTTSLNNIGGIINGNVNVTWHLKFNADANTDEYWTMEWTTAPSISNMPAKVELWVDGVKVSGGNVVLNGPDDLNKIYAAVTDADGKIISCHTSVANAADVTGVTNIALLRETTEEIILPVGVKLNKNGFTAANVNTAVAVIGTQKFASLQAAINAVKDDETITLVDNVAENVTVVQAPDMAFTIDGNGKTMNGTITIDGKSEAYASAGVTIKNLKFNAANIAVDACINLSDGTTATRYTNNVTVENCTFTGGNKEKAAIKSYQGGDKNLTVTGCAVDNTMHSLIQAANIAGVVVDGCTVESKNGINLNSSSNVVIKNSTIDVNGYAVRAGVSGGTSGKIELANNTLKTNGSEDAVIVIRGTASEQIDLAMSKNVVSGATHISGTTNKTKISADANYWDSKEGPVTSGTEVAVNSYYKDEALQQLVRIEKGSIYAYVYADRIFGDVTTNAAESLVVEIIGADGNVIGTSTLEKPEHRDGTMKTLTWRINFGADDSGSWAMQWNEGAPSINNIPTKVRVKVDGKPMAEAAIKYTANGDGQSPVVAAKNAADGKFSFVVAEGKFNLDTAAETLNAAIAAGDNVAILAAGTYKVPTGKDLTITGAVEGVKFAEIGAHNMGGASMTFNNVTFEYGNENYKGLQHSGNLVYNNCTINGQVFLYGQKETFNNCTFNQTSADAYNVWTYSAKEVTFNECIFNSAGKSVLIYHESASVTNNVTVTESQFIASQAVDGKAAIEMDSSLSGAISLTIDGETTATGFGTGNVSGNSLWNNKKGNANAANNDITVVVNGVTFLAPVFDAKIGDVQYRSLQEAINAVQNGETITLLNDIAENVTLAEKVGLYYTIDGAGKTMNGTITVKALSDTQDNRRITIQNINFVETDNAKSTSFISSVETNHYPQLTIEGCTFTGSGYEDDVDEDVAVRLKTAYGAVIKNCTGTGLHSFLQNTGGWNLTIENVKVTESNSAFALGTVQGVTVKGCTVDVAGYGIRLDAGYNNNAVIESNTIEAFIPVVVRKATVNSNIAVNGTNNLTATNNDGIWCAIGTSEYEANGAMPTAATGNVVVALNDAALDSKGIYGNALAGQGTAEAPYLINNIGELVLFRNSVNAGETKYSAPGVHVALGADIDMTGVNWVGIGSATAEHGFMGNFDGKGFKIKNLTIDNPTLDSDGYAYAGLFAVTEGTDKNNQNIIKNLTIENVTINTTGHIVSAAIAYPYYTIVDNVTVCGNIAITGGDYTAGVLAYTRRCVNASNLSIIGENNSFVKGAQVVGGVISDIQMNGGLKAEYSNFSAKNIAVIGDQMVGGISGNIATQTLNGATVENVTLTSGDARVGTVAGCFGGTSTITDVTVNNVTGATAVIGATYNGAKAVEARIVDTYYETFAAAYAVAQAGETVTMLADLTMSEILVLDKAITLDGNDKTLTSTAARAINVSGADGVTIQNLIINATGERAINVIGGATNVTIDKVTATAANYTVNLAGSAAGAVVAIKNSNLTGLNVVNVAAAGADVTVKNTTINTVDNSAKEGYSSLALNKDAVGGKIIATGVTINITGSACDDSVQATNAADGGVISINGSTDGVDIDVAAVEYGNYYYGFTTIEAAIKHAEAGQTVKLVRDVTVAEPVAINKAITLDGNGKILTYTGSNRAITVENIADADIDVTIKNLTINNTASYTERGINYNENGTLTLENVTVNGEHTTYAINLPGMSQNAKVVIKDSKFTGLIALNIWGANTQVTAESSEFYSVDHSAAEGYAAIKLNNNGSTAANNSTVVINGGKVIAKDENGAASIAVEDCTNGSTVTISDNTKVVGSTTKSVAIISYGSQFYTFSTIEEAIAEAKDGETIELISDVTISYGARKLLATAAAEKAVTIDGKGHTLTLNSTDSDWSSIGLENNNKLVLKNMTINKAGKGATSGAWNTHAIIFSTNVEMENVTVNNAVAVAADAAFTDVVFNEANGYYSLWIEANGQTVTVKGGSMTATNGGRGIKIADEYISAPAKVKLSVDGTEFNTAKKAAVLVSSKAGAEITAANVNIENVVADNVNFVWVDEDWATYFGNVQVTGATVAQEGIESFVAAVTVNGAVKAYYATIAKAIEAVQEGETVTILAGEHSEGTIKLPATLKNVTIKGAEGAVLKDMTISAADGNAYSYVGLTFDGITFDNSRLLFTGWRNGEELIENLTVTNCTFKNLNDNTNNAAVHINKDASKAVKNFTFTNNVIDGATGGSKSGIYAQVTGNVVVSGNVINDVSFRPYVIQVTTDDGVEDNFTVTGNTFSGSAVGRAQGLGNNAEGTDNVNLVVSENIFKGITDAQQICYWNFNAETTTADLSKNYYDVNIIEKANKFYFNAAAADASDLVAMGVYPYYAELNADGTINKESLVQAPVAVTDYTGYATVTEAINAAANGATVEILAGTIDEAIAPWTGDSQHKLEKSITIVGAKNFGTTLTGGMFLGYNDGTVRDNTITVKGINFVGKGVVVANQKNVVIEGNKFTGINALVSDKHANSNCAVLVIGTSKDMSIAATVKNNVIENVANAGIYLSQVGAVVVEGNTVTGTKHNALTVSAATTATVDVKNNTFAQWGLGGEGRAMRISGAATVNVNENVMSYKGTMPEEFVKVTGATAFDASANYWNGEYLLTEGLLAGVDPLTVAKSYYTDAEKQNLVELTATKSVAKIGKTYYVTIDAAFAAAQAGEEVTILAGGYTGGLTVNKAITVKGETDADGKVEFTGKLSIRANGATVKNLNFTNNSGTAAYVGAKDVTIDGCSLVGSNGLYQSYTSGTVTFKNSYIKGGTYGIHFDGNAGGNIVIDNCTVIGWTSFAGTINNVAISGTTFAKGNYNQLRLYQNATFTDCTFNEKMNIDWGSSNKTAEFTSCSVEGDKELTEIISLANIATKGLEVTIDDVPVCVAAKVDGKYYLTLQAAIDAATEGQTVTILSDIALTEGVTVAADDNIFINLNGKTVSMETAEAAVAALIKNNGTLTIESSVDGGKLSFLATAPSAANAYASNTISNYGTLTINSGTVENLSTGGACYALDNYAGSTATIIGGKLTAEKTAVRIFNWTNGEDNAAELNVEGGEIISNDGYGINVNAGNAPYVALNISGGTITTNDTDYNLAVYVVNKNSAENFTADISGGTFNGNFALNGVTSTTMVRGNVTVTGGTFDGVICYGEPACQFIAGGSYKAEFTEDYLVYGYQLEANAETGLYDANCTGERKEVTFIDGEFTEYTNNMKIKVGTLTYKRTISAAWQAFYVPFQVPVDVLAAQGFEVAYINGVRRSDYNEDGVFDEGFKMELIMIHGGKGNANGSGKTLKANYPYFIRPVGTQKKDLTIVLNDAWLYAANDVTYDCSTFTEKFEITGNSSQVVVNSTDNEFRYVVSSKGEWSQRTTPGNVKPFRFYMTVTSRDGSSPLVAEQRSMSIVVRGEELPDGTTVIYDVYDENTEDMIFDLQGRRVLETEKGGIYIKGGKKFIAQ